MSAEQASRKLALYITQWCGFCHMVRRVADGLGVDVELRDVDASDDHRQALMSARGRGTVPVLRIVEGERDTWLPESRDIIAWLQREYG